MANSSDNQLVEIFKWSILAYLMRDGFIAYAAGAILSPFIIAGVISKLGFGKSGIIAGSSAARMMALYNGYVPAGSIVSTFQSVGAAGLGLGGIVVVGLGGVAVAIAIKKGLQELETFLTVTCENNEYPMVIFDINVKSNEDKKLLSIFNGFVFAQKLTEKRVRHFEFLIGEGSDILRNLLADKYGMDALTLTQNGFLLILRDFSSKI
ncbi:706_t:CDS:1 [Acaulospora morrowiae]|uniref:706_t:CDS:1 n=1 Tax=Acaulospora morrowiae TaxID=94023 RepID=A0A9N9GXH6_9GLOM|nr:706_t:CDS:1 [Acaulospora morrowiae]